MNWIVCPINSTGRSLSSLKKDPFNSGEPELDKYLKQYAKKNDESGIAKTFVALPEDETGVIAGYYSCSMSVIDPQGIPTDLRNKLPSYPTPAMLIGKLAVDKSMQGTGLGKKLLRHAFENAIDISQKVGVYAVRVDALHEQAKEYYKKRGFLELQDTPVSLFLPIETIKEAIKRTQEKKA
ncbi:GNAT family N-acetyltransferase [Coleofasciculus sp. FACHB-SPT36]|uniref:GNAT family N-acetyltransferase n=1 Tax=Cyanophyceae TaxID=3028117 RepID=UPI00321FD4F2